LPKIPLQAIAVQTPPAQVGAPLAELQARPQSPQWLGLLLRFTSQEPSPSQSACG
jgi:hypothetical protein